MLSIYFVLRSFSAGTSSSSANHHPGGNGGSNRGSDGKKRGIYDLAGPYGVESSSGDSATQDPVDQRRNSGSQVHLSTSSSNDSENNGDRKRFVCLRLQQTSLLNGGVIDSFFY